MRQRAALCSSNSRNEADILYIVIAILLFSFLIFIHELGHFIAAKLSGVQVNEFALFMGPKIFAKKIGETTYRINWIPIGGYCAMEGEDGDSENPRAFSAVKVWKRLVILCAGSFMNLVAGFLIVLLITACTAEGIATTEITRLEPQSDLVAAGIQEGDEIYAIDGNRVFISSELSLLLSRNNTGVFDFTVLRDGKKLDFDDVTLTKKDFNDGTQPRYGLSYGGFEKATLGNVMSYSWNSCRYFSRLVWFGLSDLVSGNAGLNDLGGPVKIVEVVNEAGQQAETTADGVWNTLYLFAFIAVNLAVMNMLPIPALDGGRVVILLLTCIIEKITRKKLNPKYEAYLNGACMVLLLAFMAFITLHDVIGLFH